MSLQTIACIGLAHHHLLESLALLSLRHLQEFPPQYQDSLCARNATLHGNGRILKELGTGCSEMRLNVWFLC